MLYAPSLSQDCGLQASAHLGAFALRAGRALSLKPAHASLLRIVQGGAWVTLPSRPGDHFLRAGDELRVPPHDAVVLEAWRTPQAQPSETLYFDWDPVPMQVPQQAPVSRPALTRASQRAVDACEPAGAAPQALWAGRARPSYCTAVLQPLADLRAALVLGAGAAVRLGWGLLGLGAGKLWDAAAFLAASRARSSTV